MRLVVCWRVIKSCVLPSISGLLICLFLAGPLFEEEVWLYPVPWALKQHEKVPKTEFSPLIVGKNLPFSETSPLLLTIPGFGARLRVEWKHLAAQTGRADHQQPFKRLRRWPRLPRLVLWVVLALCMGRNPAHVKLLLPQLPCFFVWSWCVFWKQSTIFDSRYLARCQHIGGKASWCFHCVSSGEGTNLSSARSVRYRHWQLRGGAGKDALTKSSWHHSQASPSERLRASIHSWGCQQVIVSACDPPEDHTSYVQALKRAMTFSSFECRRDDLSAGYLLM